MGKKIGELRGRKVKADYQNDDFYQIRIVMYLSAYGEANLTQLQMKGKYGITSNKVRLIRLLGEMIDAGWIKKTISPHSPNVKVYSLGEKGHQMKDFIKELIHNEPSHPLFNCKLFDGIKSLD